MKKALMNTLGTFVVSVAFTCIVGLIFLDIIGVVFNEKNISKSIQQVNIKDILSSNSEQYEEMLEKYTDSTNILNNSSMSTSFSQEELESIVNSEEYADILGSYIIDEDIFNELDNIDNLEEINTKDYEEILNSISTTDLEELLKENDIDYNEKDIWYITNTVPAVAPTVAKEVGTLNVNNSSFDILGMFGSLSEKTMKVAWIFLIISIVALVAIYFKNYFFIVMYAIIAGITCLGIKAIDIFLNKGLEKIPTEYKATVDIFVVPLEKKLDYYCIMFLIITIVAIIAFVVCNMVFVKDSIGDSINFLHLIRGFDEEDDEDKNNSDKLDDFSDEFADIDLSSIEVRDINKEIDEGWF